MSAAGDVASQPDGFSYPPSIAFVSSNRGPTFTERVVDFENSATVQFSVADVPADGTIEVQASVAARIADREAGVTQAFNAAIESVQAAGALAFVAAVTGEAAARWQVDTTGMVRWGPGGAAPLDTNLYRSGPAALATDNSLSVGVDLGVGRDLTVARDVTVSRSLVTAGTLRTNRDLVSLAANGTFTPELANGLFQQVDCQPGVTAVTIGQPTINGVGFGVGSQTALLVVAIRNLNNVALTITWNALFQAGAVGLQTSLASGAKVRTLFVWDPSTVAWRALSNF